jgi:hypothetical protein
MKTTAKQIIFIFLPPELIGTLEFYLRPHLKTSLGGPFNGQQIRQTIFLELLSTFKFAAIIETGTYRGGTTQFFATRSLLPVFTVEKNPRLYCYSKRRLSYLKNVHVELNDSRVFLESIAYNPNVPKSNVFFYLDAHWDNNFPAFEEIETIIRFWTSSIIMIDDFRVPGDNGYIYDDYGSGNSLSLESMPSLAQLQLNAFFPAKPSELETGAKCGCVVLVPPGESTSKMSTVRSLKRYENN